MKEFLHEIEIDGRRFIRNQDGTLEFQMHDARIRLEEGMLGWYATLITLSGRHADPTPYGTPEAAGRAALDYWKDEIAESDEADAQDSERDHQDYVRDNRLRTRDVL